MEFELEKKHWLNAKRTNEELIFMNLMQIEMAKEVIKLCDAKISEFPEEIKKDEPEN